MRTLFYPNNLRGSVNKFRGIAGVFTALLAMMIFASSCEKAGVPIVKPEGPPSSAFPVTANLDKLTSFKSFKGMQSAPYDLTLIGDSYVQGDYFTLALRQKFLAAGYRDGGPGYCSFSRALPGDSIILDASIDRSQLTFSYNSNNWTLNQIDTFGPNGEVKSATGDATIKVTSTVALNTMTMIYEKHAGAGDFRYRVNGGTWTTVSAEAAQSTMANLVINTETAGASIQLDIQSLKAGQIFCGVVGRKGGNALTLHKVGISGGIAIFFGQNAQWDASVMNLNSKSFVIMFGTNEMELNLSPSDLKASLGFLIQAIKRVNPDADVLMMCPPETKYEKLEPRKYRIRDFGKVIYDAAMDNDYAFINLADVFPHFSQASIDQGYMDKDGKHPGAKGGELIAKTVYEAYVNNK